VSSPDNDPYGPEYHRDEDTEQARAALADRVETQADARWKLHRRAVTSDKTMDPRRRSAYLDTTLIDITDAARILDLSPHRISTARGGRKSVGGVPLRMRKWPHPSVYPPPARIREFVAGKPVYWWFRGEIIRWAEQRGLNLLDLETGEMVKLRNRSGRPRKSRTVRSKPHTPGTPRKNKQRADPED
jgi:hypothetical protein